MIYIKTDKGNFPVAFKPMAYELHTEPDKYRINLDGDLLSADDGFNLDSVAPNAGDRITLSNGNYWERGSTGLAFTPYYPNYSDGTSATDVLYLGCQTRGPLYGYGFIIGGYPESDLLYIPNFIYNPDNQDYVSGWASQGITKAEYKTKSDALWNFLTGSIVTDPYEPGGYSGEGGGSGTFSDTGDTIAIPSAPTLSAAGSGMISIYNPTASQLALLSNYLWTGTFIDNVKKLWASPMDSIISLAILPVTPTTGAAIPITVSGISTGVSAKPVSSQYVEVDCGSLSITKYYDSALDHAGYTKYSLYLPYVGTHQINADEIVGKSVQVKYMVDVLTGACVAFVKCGDSVLYQFSGSCIVQIPISGRDFGDVVRGALSIAGAGAALVASGGMSAPVSGAVAAGAAMTMANNAINMKPTVQHSGSMGGAAGLMGVQSPYLIVERPKQSLASDYKSLEGYPSNISARIGDLSGFTKVEKVHLENIPATDAELTELENILKEGILI